MYSVEENLKVEWTQLYGVGEYEKRTCSSVFVVCHTRRTKGGSPSALVTLAQNTDTRNIHSLILLIGTTNMLYIIAFAL